MANGVAPSPYKGVSSGALREHLDAADDADAGRAFTAPLRSTPSTAAGAPASAEESRDTLARLKRMAGFEAQDFDPVEHDLEREWRAHRTERDYAAEAMAGWALAFLIGVAMGAAAFAVDWGIDKLNDARFLPVLASISAGGGFWGPFARFVGVSAAFAGVAGALVSFVEPLAAGSGVAEIKTYLNGIHIRGLLTIRTLIAKLAGVVFAIGGGLIAGKEGPFVHGGGIVGGGVGAMGSASLSRLLGRRVAAPRWAGGYFRSDADHRDFTAVGTAAGVATAFAAPIGGLLFTVEEGASFYSTSIFWRGFLATGAGVLTLHLAVAAAAHPGALAAAHFGRFRDFGLYADSLAFYGSRMFYYVWDVPLFCAMGAAGGALGAAFVAANVRVTAWRAARVPPAARWRRLAEVVALAAATAAVFFVVSYASPCLPLPPPDDLRYLEASEDADDAFYAGGGQAGPGAAHFPRLWCPPGHYSAHGQLFFTPLSQALRLVIHLGEPLPEARQDAFGVHPASLALFGGGCFALMCVTNGVGASTGMFVPSLAVGAAGGRLVGQALRAALRAAGVTLPVSVAAYAVVGAASFMAGATRMTLTTTVMVMETTGALQLIVPLIAAVFCAKVAGDALGDGVDDTHLKLRGAPVLDEPGLTARQKMVADKLTVGELAASPVVALPPVAPVARVLAALASCAHSAFVVTPDADAGGGVRGGGPAAAGLAAAGVDGGAVARFAAHGVILRDVLLAMLTHRLGWVPAGTAPPPVPALPATQAGREALLALLAQRPVKARRDAALAAALASLAGCPDAIDLRGFMQRHPFVVPADASLSRAYRLFRTLGLRHLLVAPACPQAVGLITRKDICEANARLALGRKANAGLATASERLTRPGLPFIPYAPYDPTVGGGSGAGLLAGASDAGDAVGASPRAADGGAAATGVFGGDARRRGAARASPSRGEMEMAPLLSGAEEGRSAGGQQQR